MGRGVSAGGGQSSLGYLFGGGDDSQAPAKVPSTNPNPEAVPKPATDPKLLTASPPENSGSQVPAGVPASTNNYFRADGQNCGNFLTERPSTKVHAAPGGGSSLNYLFGGDGK